MGMLMRVFIRGVFMRVLIVMINFWFCKVAPVWFGSIFILEGSTCAACGNHWHKIDINKVSFCVYFRSCNRVAVTLEAPVLNNCAIYA